MKIQDNVYWLDIGQVNCYLCRDEDGYTLIDAATPRRVDDILAALQTFGGADARLVRILLTHADLDHAGSLAAVRERTDATVYAGAATAALLAEGRSPKHMPAVAQFVVDHVMRYGRVEPAHVHIIADGDVLPVLGGLRVIASPGHTPDHFAFYSPSTGILFAGDALNTRENRLQPSPPRITADSVAADASARRLLELQPTLIACGHGAPLTVDSTEIDAFLKSLPSTGD